jgi:SAM-dependent methyltransferase
MSDPASSGATDGGASFAASRFSSSPDTSFEPVELGAGQPHDTETPDVETSSDAYARSRFGGAVGQWLLAQQTHLLATLIDMTGPAPLRILDVGGGHAQAVPLLLERGHDVVVQGSSSECFRRLAPLLERYPDRLRVCASSLWSLPFDDGSFDAVIAVRLLGHVVRWRPLVTEMARVSNRFLLLEFARASRPLLPLLGGLIFAAKRRFEGTTRPFFSYSEEALASELMKHGLRVRASGGQFAVPMVAHRMGRSVRVSAAVESTLRRVGVGDARRSPVIMLAERSQVM